MNFRAKLALGFAAILAVLLVAASYASLRNVDNLTARLRSSYADSVLPLRHAQVADQAFNNLRLHLVLAVLQQGTAREEALARVETDRFQFEEAFAAYVQRATHEPAMQDVLAKYGAREDMNLRMNLAMAQVKRDYPLLRARLATVIALFRAGQQRAAESAYQQTIPFFTEIDRATDVLMDVEVKEGEYLDKESQVLARAATQQIPLVAAFAMISGVFLVLIVARSVTEPLVRLTGAAQKVSTGDLDQAVEVESRDEVGQLALAFNRMTESLRTARGELEDRVEARTRELAAANKLLNAQMAERERTTHALEQAKDAAESANRAKSEFLAKMSHELRTPLHGVIGSVELILNTDLGPEQREYLQIARTSADGLLQLIDDILDFSRAESGKLHFEDVDFDLRDSLQDALVPLKVRAAEKGLELTCLVAPEVPKMLVGDPGRLRQVILNLVGNAIKFTDRGRVALEVDPQESTAEEVSLLFAVADTGIGILEEHRAHIFAPFEQADGSITRKYGGTGLGLAISAQLVDIMGGSIWVDSEVGKGSTFHFTARFGLSTSFRPLGRRLPVRRSHMLEAVINALAPPDEGGLPDRHHPQKPCWRILVAEDNIINQKIAVRALQQRGHCVEVANNGREALAKLDQQPFDLVLMDLQMPELDGFQTTRAIRERERATARHVPIIAITAHARHGDRERCLQAGMDGYVSKPLQLQELLEQIHLMMLARSSENRIQHDDHVHVVLPDSVDSSSGNLDGLSPELMDAFLSDTPQQVERLRLAAQNRDAAALKSVAHYLKGSAMYIGARKMTTLCRDVETAATQDVSGAAAAVAVLDAEAARVCSTVQCRLQQRKVTHATQDSNSDC